MLAVSTSAPEAALVVPAPAVVGVVVLGMAGATQGRQVVESVVRRFLATTLPVPVVDDEVLGCSALRAPVPISLESLLSKSTKVPRFTLPGVIARVGLVPDPLGLCDPTGVLLAVLTLVAPLTLALTHVRAVLLPAHTTTVVLLGPHATSRWKNILQRSAVIVKGTFLLRASGSLTPTPFRDGL
jgi:hypothetical protein